MRAPREVDLRIGRGQPVALTGSSGCRTSTLLQAALVASAVVVLRPADPRAELGPVLLGEDRPVVVLSGR